MSILLFCASENVNFTLKGLDIIGGMAEKKYATRSRVRVVSRKNIVFLFLFSSLFNF